MYNRKSVGPRMKPWGTSALTEYSCQDFPWRTTRSHLLLKKKRNKAKYLTRNFVRRKFVKKTSMPNPVKSLGYIKCYSSSSPRLLKTLAVLSDTIARRSAIDWEDLKIRKSHWKSEKRLRLHHSSTPFFDFSYPPLQGR